MNRDSGRRSSGPTNASGIFTRPLNAARRIKSGVARTFSRASSPIVPSHDASTLIGVADDTQSATHASEGHSGAENESSSDIGDSVSPPCVTASGATPTSAPENDNASSEVPSPALDNTTRSDAPSPEPNSLIRAASESPQVPSSDNVKLCAPRPLAREISFYGWDRNDPKRSFFHPTAEELGITGAHPRPGGRASDVSEKLLDSSVRASSAPPKAEPDSETVLMPPPSHIPRQSRQHFIEPARPKIELPYPGLSITSWQCGRLSFTRTGPQTVLLEIIDTTPQPHGTSTTTSSRSDGVAGNTSTASSQPEQPPLVQSRFSHSSELLGPLKVSRAHNLISTNDSFKLWLARDEHSSSEELFRSFSTLHYYCYTLPDINETRGCVKFQLKSLDYQEPKRPGLSRSNAPVGRSTSIAGPCLEPGQSSMIAAASSAPSAYTNDASKQNSSSLTNNVLPAVRGKSFATNLATPASQAITSPSESANVRPLRPEVGMIRRPRSRTPDSEDEAKSGDSAVVDHLPAAEHPRGRTRRSEYAVIRRPRPSPPGSENSDNNMSSSKRSRSNKEESDDSSEGSLPSPSKRRKHVQNGASGSKAVSPSPTDSPRGRTSGQAEYDIIRRPRPSPPESEVDRKESSDEDKVGAEPQQRSSLLPSIPPRPTTSSSPTSASPGKRSRSDEDEEDTSSKGSPGSKRRKTRAAN